MGDRKKGDDRRFDFGLISFGVATLSLVSFAMFVWGYLAAGRGLFPYEQIRWIKDGGQALSRLFEVEVATTRSYNLRLSPGVDNGVTISSPQADTSSLLVSLFDGETFVVQLMDRQGNVLHRWRPPLEDFRTAKDTGIPLSVGNIVIADMYPGDDGSLYVLLAWRALMQLDRDGNLMWSHWLKDRSMHHAIARDQDGSIWTLWRRNPVDRADRLPYSVPDHYDEGVVHFSATGEILEDFSVLGLIRDNSYDGILYFGEESFPAPGGKDPLHLNDIDILTASQASAIPRVKAGDIMVSMRTVNTVMILDRNSHEILWSATGPFLRQHDPDVIADGSMLVFDNRHARRDKGLESTPPKLGWSRLVALDPVTRHIMWEYRGSDETPLCSAIHGSVDELPNGNILATSSDEGRIIEVDRESRQIVWEFRNRIEENYVGRIKQAYRPSDSWVESLGIGNETREETTSSVAEEDR